MRVGCGKRQRRDCQGGRWGPPPNGLEAPVLAEAGKLPLIVVHASGPGTTPNPSARRVSFSELLGPRREAGW